MFWKPWKLEERLQEHREEARVVNGGTLCQWDLIAKAVPGWKRGELPITRGIQLKGGGC